MVLRLSKILFVQFFADISKKSKAVITIYIYASECSCFAFRRKRVKCIIAFIQVYKFHAIWQIATNLTSLLKAWSPPKFLPPPELKLPQVTFGVKQQENSDEDSKCVPL